MKKTFTLCTAALIIMSCGKKAENTKTTDNKTEQNIKLKSEAETEEPAEEEMEAQTLFASPDLALYGLYGQVLSVKQSEAYISESGDIGEPFNTNQITFDKDCKLTKDDNIYFTKERGKITRDEEGRIKTMNFTAGEMMEYDYSYTYKGERLLTATVDFMGECSGGYTETYTYDEAGNLAKTVCEGSTEGTNYTHTITYTIKKTDEKGNWTERSVKTVEEESYDEEPDNVSTNTNYKYEYRTIKYQ